MDSLHDVHYKFICYYSYIMKLSGYCLYYSDWDRYTSWPTSHSSVSLRMFVSNSPTIIPFSDARLKEVFSQTQYIISLAYWNCCCTESQGVWIASTIDGSWVGCCLQFRYRLNTQFQYCSLCDCVSLANLLHFKCSSALCRPRYFSACKHRLATLNLCIKYYRF